MPGRALSLYPNSSRSAVEHMPSANQILAVGENRVVMQEILVGELK